MVHLSKVPHMHVVEGSPHLDSSAWSAIILLLQGVSRFSGSQGCSRRLHARGRLLLVPVQLSLLPPLPPGSCICIALAAAAARAIGGGCQSVQAAS